MAPKDQEFHKTGSGAKVVKTPHWSFGKLKDEQKPNPSASEQQDEHCVQPPEDGSWDSGYQEGTFEVRPVESDGKESSSSREDAEYSDPGDPWEDYENESSQTSDSSTEESRSTMSDDQPPFPFLELPPEGEGGTHSRILNPDLGISRSLGLIGKSGEKRFVNFKRFIRLKVDGW
ncbi:uncharacterized protein KY384_001255 [Bacidia gigantensis]|uniref:uncharacterized protein n=1 Tax=Bacidia gigantensis TaxID=2732470 RepID=UPI001D048451|nr:uncharacterized protein KY384_001255 [Bacidia gigantensis]KAG8534410.1 hypothetical protein KY384_001255 [Bacidia gigantensis]